MLELGAMLKLQLEYVAFTRGGGGGLGALFFYTRNCWCGSGGGVGGSHTHYRITPAQVLVLELKTVTGLLQ